MSETKSFNRKHPRLKQYDYNSSGRYFITVCTHERRQLLSKVIVGRGLAPAKTSLTEVGKIVEDELLILPLRYPELTIEKYVIMPNHIHAIFCITAPAQAGAFLAGDGSPTVTS